MLSYANESHLAETDWLGSRLRDPQLRRIDCRVYVGIDAVGDVRFESLRADRKAAHNPGTAYVDCVGDLANPSSDLPFMLPSLHHCPTSFVLMLHAGEPCRQTRRQTARFLA